jgi:hypothetical protein
MTNSEEMRPLVIHEYIQKRRSFIFFVSYSFVDDYDDYSDPVVDDDVSSVFLSLSSRDDYGAVVTASVLIGESLALYRLSPAKWF